ncbi:MAG: NADH-quinone oxidoreductase subunit L [Deltaproteobacteria bacterium]|nr:NADH-quinone oxidoreductase subunit L [Deltaproteobacteria bacterium]
MTDYNSSALVVIILLPAVGALLNGLFGRRFPRWLVSTVGCASVGLSFALAIWAAYFVFVSNGEERLRQDVYSWISTGGLSISIGLTLDALSTIMVLVVTGVSFVIHIYSIGYMEGDPSYARYFSYLNLFVFSMLILVLGDSLPVLFVGWEGVGLCSYLLIGFWFEDPAKAAAGKKAFIANRIGDLGFLIGMFVLFGFAHTLSIDGLAKAVASGAVPTVWITAACLLLFVGATGKSAQIPLYVWLPDAMAGPTPVSALIHAATMVTAGVYMVARLSFMFALSPTASAVVTLVGAVTAFFAATIGIAQTDIKKVLAYSTVSQLGYMFIGVGVGAYAAGIFHLMTHAFFKACLFLGSGAVIHALSGEQDMMRMGGLRRKMPWTYWTFLMSTLAISGCPFFSGFFSKDEILWKALSTSSPVGGWVHTLAYGLGLAAAAITAFYMFRLVFLTFHGESRIPDGVHVHQEKPVMSWPLAVLAFLAVVGGLPGASMFHVHWFEHFLEPVVATANVTQKGFASLQSSEWWAAGGSVLVGLLGFALAFNLYLQRTSGPGYLAARFKRTYDLVKNKYYVDEIYEIFPIKFIYYLALGLWRIVDTLIIDGLCVNGPAYAARGLGYIGRELQSGNLQVYAFWIFIGFSTLLLYLAHGLGLI